MKKRAKKLAAIDKVESLRTGGGSYTPSIDAVDQALLSVLGNRAQPLPNDFDSDANYQCEYMLLCIPGVPKKRTPWFILTITLVNMDRF